MSKELRTSIRAEFSEDSRSVSGYACLFERESQDLGGFTEIISRGALDGVLEKSDILALLDHSSFRGVLARYKRGTGSLKLSIDERGLRYEFEAPNTALGQELVESLKRGDIDESSFAFTVEDEDWSKKSDGMRLRRINKFKRLYDVSPVYFPAYEGTKVGLRSATDVLSEIEEREKRQKEQEEKEIKEQKEKEQAEADKRNRFSGYAKALDDYYKP